MAIDFDGVNDYIAVAAHSNIDNIFSNPGGTIVLWVNLDALPGDNASLRIVGKTAVQNEWNLLITDLSGATAADNSLRFLHGFSSTHGDWHSVDEQFTGETGNWHHIGLTYNAALASINPIFYFDGLADTSPTKTSSPSGTKDDDSGSALEIGRGTLEPMNGRVQDFRLFKRRISREQMSMLAAGYHGPLGGEVLWYDCNDFETLTNPDGSTLIAGTHYLHDKSASGLRGDPIGGAIARAYDGPMVPTAWHTGALYTAAKVKEVSFNLDVVITADLYLDVELVNTDAPRGRVE